MKNLLGLVFALNLLVAVNGRILRIPCMIDATFDVFFVNKRLQGSTLAVFNDIDDAGCTLKCAEFHRCASYNYQWIKKTCEINHKFVQKDNSTELLDANGWVFKTTNYSNRLVGPTCNALKPCEPGVLCVEKCSPPFYECSPCDSFDTGQHCSKPIDLDSCASSPCKQGSQCLDKNNDYECKCVQGYTGKNCDIDIDECASFPCFNNGTCENKIGKFECQCFKGYKGINCEQDVHECMLNTHNCHANADCTETFGSFKCSCKTGLSGDGIINCTDINECQVGTHSCPGTAVCTNTIGSFSCSCKTGFSGDGFTCTDINECQLVPSKCHEKATCSNSAGSFTCKCIAGYNGNGITSCNDVNECTQGTHSCHSKAECSNTVGSFSCTCSAGYSGDGFSCYDINECHDNTNNCHLDARCTNTIGSFTCTCMEGYTGEGTSCIDVDECATALQSCPFQTECKNFDGMFVCTENIALGKDPSQSSIHNYNGINLVQAFGNDGNRSGHWSVCAITSESPMPWWQVDLGRRLHVGKVLLRSGSAWEQTKINPFDVRVGDDSSDGGALNSICQGSQSVQSGQIKVIFCAMPAIGRYVSVLLTRNQYLQVCELEVYEGNVALGRPTSLSLLHSFNNIDLVPSFGNDGSRSGQWEVCAWAKDSPMPWWQVDLGGSILVGGIYIQSSTNFGQTNINPFSVSVGNNKTNGGRSNPLCAEDQVVESGQPKEITCVKHLLGRYVSVFLNRNTHIVVCELEVYKAKLHSCEGWYQAGARKNGIYGIEDEVGLVQNVYCDFSSEANFVWTLILSFSLGNNSLFNTKQFPDNAPINEYQPNWGSHRLSKHFMQRIASDSTHWRCTCSFPAYGYDGRDCMRARLSDVDLLTFRSGCKSVEYIDIRGYRATNHSVQLWQVSGTFFHVNSASDTCFTAAVSGSVVGEDNFGYYENVNKNFRCTESAASTTQYWFGKEK